MQPEHGHEMCEHTPPPQPVTPAPRPRSPEPPSPPRTAEIHTLTGLDFLELVTAQTLRPVAPTPREAQFAGIMSDVDVDQHLLSGLAGGDSLPDIALLDVLSRMSISRMSLSRISLSLMSLSPMFLCLMFLSLRRTRMAR